jgi:hypothetical protein
MTRFAVSARFNIEPILEWFGAVIPPRSSKLKCPFHDDNHDSGYIPESRQYFKCLACGVQGDAVRLLYMFKLEESGALVKGDENWRDAYARAKELAGEPDESAPGTPVRGGRVPGRPRDYRGHSRYSKTRSS